MKVDPFEKKSKIRVDHTRGHMPIELSTQKVQTD